MAWTTPRTWVDGEVVTASLLNTHVRDNMLQLSTHSHGGAAGDGDDVFTGVDSVTFDDISAPAAPGASKTIIFSESGKLKQRAGAAGSTEEFSVDGHTHTTSEVAKSGGDTFLEAVTIPTWSNASTSYATGPSRSLAAASADNSIVYGGWVYFEDNTGIGGGSTVFVRITVDGVQQIEHSEAIASGSNAGLAVNYVMTSPDTSAVTYATQYKNDNGNDPQVSNLNHDMYAEVTDA